MSSAAPPPPAVTRNVRSPSSSAMLKGGWSLRWTPPAVTSATVAPASSPSNGVNGTQRREIGATATSGGFAQRLEDLLVVGLLVDLVDVLVDDLPLLIDDEERPLGVPFRAIDPVPARHLALGLEIREEVVRDPAEALRPRGVAGNRVDRNTQHVGIRPLEAAEVRLVRGHLDRSNGGPGERVEGDEYVLLAAEVREPDLLALAVVAWQLEVWSDVAHVDRHDCVPPPVGFSLIQPDGQPGCSDALHAVARDTPPPATRHHERVSLVGLELPCELEGGARCGEAGLGRHAHAPLAAAKRDLVRDLRPCGQRVVGAAPVAPAHRVADLQVDRVEATRPGGAEASVLARYRVRDLAGRGIPL